MPQKAIEIPILFPANRTSAIKINADATVLDLKRAICKEEAVDVLGAGDNADLLGRRFTAPATFRLILKGLELSNSGTLEYYHLTTKGRNQLPVRIVAKHESLVDDDEALNEDYAIPDTVAHLEEEKQQQQRAREEQRAAEKAKHQTFHVEKKTSAGHRSNNSRTSSSGAAAAVGEKKERSSSSPNRNRQKQQQQQQNEKNTIIK